MQEILKNKEILKKRRLVTAESKFEYLVEIVELKRPVTLEFAYPEENLENSRPSTRKSPYSDKYLEDFECPMMTLECYATEEDVYCPMTTLEHSVEYSGPKTLEP